MVYLFSKLDERELLLSVGRLLFNVLDSTHLDSSSFDKETVHRIWLGKREKNCESKNTTFSNGFRIENWFDYLVEYELIVF